MHEAFPSNIDSVIFFQEGWKDLAYGYGGHRRQTSDRIKRLWAESDSVLCFFLHDSGFYAVSADRVSLVALQTGLMKRDLFVSAPKRLSRGRPFYFDTQREGTWRLSEQRKRSSGRLGAFSARSGRRRKRTVNEEFVHAGSGILAPGTRVYLRFPNGRGFSLMFPSDVVRNFKERKPIGIRRAA